MSSNFAKNRPQLAYMNLVSVDGDADLPHVTSEDEMLTRSTNYQQLEEEKEDKRVSTLLDLLEQQDIDRLAAFVRTNPKGLLSLPLKDGNTALHLTASSGSWQLVQALCALGSRLDLFNSDGIAPLHVAARRGHTEVVRVLCLAGCRIDLKSRDGILAEVMSMAHGHDDITELLNSIRNPSYREEYIQQLVPSSTPLPCIKLKLLGHSGSGKTELRKALNASVLSSFLSLRLTGYSSHDNKSESDSKSFDEIELSPSSAPSSIICDPQVNFTQGIEVTQANMSGCGRFSIWEFSGHPAYYGVYDHFLGSSECVHLVVFPLDKPYNVQLQHCQFWLAFLKARIAPQEPLRMQGRSSRAPRVGLVGCKADLAQLPRNQQEDYMGGYVSSLLSKIRADFGAVFEVHHEVFVLDTTTTPSTALRSLRQYLNDIKTIVTKDAPFVTPFLRHVENLINEWRTELDDFPVVSWTQFVDAIHNKINPLACEDHLREVVQQLQLQGLVVYLAAPAQDQLILDPNWLTRDQLGRMLHPNSKLRSRITGRHVYQSCFKRVMKEGFNKFIYNDRLCALKGCFTVDDFQMRYPHCDALELMTVLETLCLCTQCDNDGDIEYEFPHLNQVETLDGLWDKSDPRYIDAVYGGVKLRTTHKDMKLLANVYSRIQVQLRRSWQEYPEQDSDLYQWGGGAKFCCGPLEAIISLEECGEAIEIKVRGPRSAAYATFFFMEDLLAMIDQVLLEMCPGLVVHKHILSSAQLGSTSSSIVHSWPPCEIFEALLQQENPHHALLMNPYTGKQEAFSNLVWFDEPQVEEVMLTGPEVSVTRLCTLLLQQLAALLDPSDPRGADWCVLAVRLGLQQHLPQLEAVSSEGYSPTVALLSHWGVSETSKATVGTLAKQLREMGREDAVRVLSNSSPLYHLVSREEFPYGPALQSLRPGISQQSLKLSLSQQDLFCASHSQQSLLKFTQADVIGPRNLSQSFQRDIVQQGSPTRQLKLLFRDVELPTCKINDVEIGSDVEVVNDDIASVSSRSTVVYRKGTCKTNILQIDMSSTTLDDISDSDQGLKSTKNLDVSLNVDCFPNGEHTSNSSDKSQITKSFLSHSLHNRSLFSLDESLSSPSSYSAIPATSPNATASSFVTNQNSEASKQQLNGDAPVFSTALDDPDITSSCTLLEHGVSSKFSSYVLPDIACDNSSSAGSFKRSLFKSNSLRGPGHSTTSVPLHEMKSHTTSFDAVMSSKGACHRYELGEQCASHI